jgi:hypothetical protein
MSLANDSGLRYDVCHGQLAFRSLPRPALNGRWPAGDGGAYAVLTPLAADMAPPARTYAALVPEQPTTDERRPPQRQLEPLDPPTVPFAIGGIALWAIIGLVLLLFRDTLSAHGHTDWLWICLAGFLLGFPGWFVMIRHDRHRAARRAQRTDQESSSVG